MQYDLRSSKSHSRCRQMDLEILADDFVEGWVKVSHDMRIWELGCLSQSRFTWNMAYIINLSLRTKKRGCVRTCRHFRSLYIGVDKDGRTIFNVVKGREI